MNEACGILNALSVVLTVLAVGVGIFLYKDWKASKSKCYLKDCDCQGDD